MPDRPTARPSGAKPGARKAPRPKPCAPGAQRNRPRRLPAGPRLIARGKALRFLFVSCSEFRKYRQEKKKKKGTTSATSYPEIVGVFNSSGFFLIVYLVFRLGNTLAWHKIRTYSKVYCGRTPRPPPTSFLKSKDKFTYGEKYRS